MRNWRINFTNDYTDLNVSKVVEAISNNFGHSWYASEISDKIIGITLADTKEEAVNLLFYLVGMLDAFCITMPDTDPATPMMQYLYSAYSLADIMPYVEREEN